MIDEVSTTVQLDSKICRYETTKNTACNKKHKSVVFHKISSEKDSRNHKGGLKTGFSFLSVKYHTLVALLSAHTHAHGMSLT